MAFGIKLVQNGIVLAAGTSVHPAPINVVANVLCYLSFTGVTTGYRWTLTKPTGSESVISSASSPGPTFTPDIDGGSYSVTLIDDASNVYVLDIVTPTFSQAGTTTDGVVANVFGVTFDVTNATDATFAAALASARTAQKPLLIYGDTLSLTTTVQLQSHDVFRGCVSVLTADASGIRVRKPTILMTVKDTDLFQGQDVHDIEFQWLRLVSAGTVSGAASRAGVTLYGTGTNNGNIRLRDCEFSAWARAVCVWDKYNVGEISRCWFYNPITGPDGAAGLGSHLVHNCYVDFAGPNAGGAGSLRGWVITGCTWSGTTGDQQSRGLAIGVCCAGFTVSYNTWDGWQHNAGICTGGAPLDENFVIENINIIGNQFLNLTYQSSRAWWFFNGCRNCSFQNNTCRNVNGDNVEISNSPGCDVLNNTFVHGGYYSQESLGGVRISGIVGSSERCRVIGNRFYDMAATGVVLEGFAPQSEIAYNYGDHIGDTAADTPTQLERSFIWLSWGSNATSQRGCRVHHNDFRNVGGHGIIVEGDCSGVEITDNTIRNVSLVGGATTHDAILTRSLTVSATTRAPDDAIVYRNKIEDLNSNTTRYAHKNIGAARVRVDYNEAFALATSPNVFNTDQADTRYGADNRTTSALPTWAVGYVQVVGSGNVVAWGAPNFGAQDVTTTGKVSAGSMRVSGTSVRFVTGAAFGADTDPTYTVDITGTIRVSTQGMTRADGANAAFSWGDNWQQNATTHTWKSANAGTSFMTLDGTNLTLTGASNIVKTGTMNIDGSTSLNLKVNSVGRVTLDTTGISFFGASTTGQQTRAGQLTGSFGSTGTAIADVGAAFSQSTLNNNFRALEDAYNRLETIIHNTGLST